MPFGLINAHSIFQKMMHVVFQNFSFVRVYVDNMVIVFLSPENYVQHLRKVFFHCKGVSQVKTFKSFFAEPQVKLLGHLLTAVEAAADPEKIATFRIVSVPKTNTKLRSFLVLASFYRRFVHSFAQKLNIG